MKGNEKGSKLSARQLQVLPHLVLSPSYEEAARRSNISAKQIHQWLKDPSFSAELRILREEMFRESLLLLKTGVKKAVQELLSLVDNNDPRIRLAAAEKILINSFKAVDTLEIEERIRRLEEIMNQPMANSQL